jgi:hypothetical protein
MFAPVGFSNNMMWNVSTMNNVGMYASDEVSISKEMDGLV